MTDHESQEAGVAYRSVCDHAYSEAGEVRLMGSETCIHCQPIVMRHKPRCPVSHVLRTAEQGRARLECLFCRQVRHIPIDRQWRDQRFPLGPDQIYDGITELHYEFLNCDLDRCPEDDRGLAYITPHGVLLTCWACGWTRLESRELWFELLLGWGDLVIELPQEGSA